jgi:hypothetical protein
MAALSLQLSDDHQARLEAASALPMINPYFIFQLPRQMDTSKNLPLSVVS